MKFKKLKQTYELAGNIELWYFSKKSKTHKLCY